MKFHKKTGFATEVKTILTKVLSYGSNTTTTKNFFTKDTKIHSKISTRQLLV
jgi:hypothetical protein